MKDYQKANRALWNERALIHAKAEFYDVEGFKTGKSTLRPIELEELGDVSGKSLLHLQCHFGLDTLSWARRGAKVTGVDFSDQAIALARSLSKELGIEANFICSDVYDLPKVLTSEFDIVFTSYGVLCWLSDLKEWAQVIAHFLKRDGIFYMVEEHPVGNVFDYEARELRVAYSYFHSPEPLECKVEGSYADPNAKVSQKVSYEWQHSLSDVLNALISAGLRIEFLHEFPFCMFQKFSFLEQGEDGWWRMKDRNDKIPLMFSLKATKE